MSMPSTSPPRSGVKEAPCWRREPIEMAQTMHDPTKSHCT